MAGMLVAAAEVGYRREGGGARRGGGKKGRSGEGGGERRRRRRRPLDGAAGAIAGAITVAGIGARLLVAIAGVTLGHGTRLSLLKPPGRVTLLGLAAIEGGLAIEGGIGAIAVKSGSEGPIVMVHAVRWSVVVAVAWYDKGS